MVSVDLSELNETFGSSSSLSSKLEIENCFAQSAMLDFTDTFIDWINASSVKVPIKFYDKLMSKF